MKLKKGSKEARDFMAKIRAKKSLGAVKKRQMPKQNKKEIGTRKFQNNTEMVLKGYDHNGNELWVTAKYYDKPKMNERKKNKESTLKGNKHTDNKSHNYKINISGVPSGDIDAMREIRLFADNDSQLYFSSKRPILQNLSKKYIKGVFDIDKASKLWLYYIENAMKKYAKEFGGKWNTLLSVHDRKLLAYEYAVETKFEFDLGNFTN